MPTPTALHEICRKAGAVFRDVVGYDIPANYGRPSAEYDAATSEAAIFDRSLVGKLEVTGPDAPQFLHNISTNEIRTIPLGGGCETYFCDARAKALFVAWIYHLKLQGKNALWLETTPGRAAALLKHLDRFLISEAVELIDVTDQFCQIHLAGPKAGEVLSAALGEPVPPLEEFQHMERTLGSQATCSIRRRDVLGVPGYDLVTVNARAESVWRLLTGHGATPAGNDTWETLRIEAGTPVYGPDIDENRFVMEVGGAARAVNYAKGCFPGQEPIVMARDRAGRVNRSFLRLKGAGSAPIAPGTLLRRDGQDVGTITSSTVSPRHGGTISLGYVHWKSTEPGTVLDADGQTVEVLGS